MRARIDDDLTKAWTRQHAREFYERQGMILDRIGPRPDRPEQIVARYSWGSA
jgi:hypothetical protein